MHLPERRHPLVMVHSFHSEHFLTSNGEVLRHMEKIKGIVFLAKLATL